VRDEQNKNRQTEEDRFIEAYLNRIDAEAPDLWDRIEAGQNISKLKWDEQ